MSIKDRDESSASPGGEDMGNQWLIKLMLYSPPGYKYIAEAVKGKTGLGFKGVKTHDTKSCFIQNDEHDNLSLQEAVCPAGCLASFEHICHILLEKSCM